MKAQAHKGITPEGNTYEVHLLFEGEEVEAFEKLLQEQPKLRMEVYQVGVATIEELKHDQAT